MFHIEREVQDFVVLTRVFGDVDLNAIDQVREAFDTALALATAPYPLVIDLDNVTFFSSAALSALHTVHVRAAEYGTEVRVVATRREVVRPLRITGLADGLNLYGNVADAVAPAMGSSRNLSV